MSRGRAGLFGGVVSVMRLIALLPVAGIAALLGACTGGGYERPKAVADAAKLLPEKVDFNWDVRPILSQNCFACHGNDANDREAGLRLDVAKAAYDKLPENPSKRAIVPGNPGASE